MRLIALPSFVIIGCILGPIQCEETTEDSEEDITLSDDVVFTTSGIHLRNAAKEFIKAGFAPNVTQEPPHHILKISYFLTEVVFERQLSSWLVRLAPGKIQWPFENDYFYTLIVVGPDCPSRDKPIYKEYLHWLIGNIPGNEVISGENITEYAGVVKDYHLGLPRFVFLVFKQPKKEKIKFDEERLPRRPLSDKRRNFSTKKFVEKYNLGNPVAGNYLTVCLDIKFPDI